jgi:hypothetical protein
MSDLKKGDIKEIIKDKISKENENKLNMKMEDITPKRDHPLYCPPHFCEDLKEGKKTKVPRFLISTLKTEGVI